MRKWRDRVDLVSREMVDNVVMLTCGASHGYVFRMPWLLTRNRDQMVRSECPGVCQWCLA